MNNTGQGGLPAVAVSVLAFLIILTIYGQVETTHDSIINANAVNHIDDVTASNAPIFSTGVQNIIDLIPLVLVGAVITAVALTALRGL